MGTYDIGINLLRRTFSSVSRREINLVNNKDLKTFLFNNEKNCNYTSIQIKTLKSFENPYKKKFYETIHESFRPDAISKAMSGESYYYMTENGKLYYKSPKNSSSKKYKVILLRKMFELLNKANWQELKKSLHTVEKMLRLLPGFVKMMNYKH